MTNLLRVILPVIFTLCSLIVFALTKQEGYVFLFLHPLIYAICFHLILFKSTSTKPFRPFLFIFTIIGFFRYVALPILLVLSGHYGGRSPVEPNDSSYQYAIFLMCWELIACTAFIIFLEKRQKKYYTNNSRVFYDKGKNYGYIVFIVFAAVMLTLNPKALLYINFIVPSILENDLQIEFLTNLTIYLFLIAKVIFLLMVIKRCQKKGKGLAFFVAFIAVALNIAVFWGTNKSDILIAGLASGLVFYQVYGLRARKAVAIIGFFSLIVVGLVNSERNPVSISDGNSKLIDRTDKVQVYTGGVYNVAIALETKEYYPESTEVEVLIFDIFRPMIGPNLLLKDKVQNYSNIYFNNRIWTYVDRRSQIIPMVGQANLFLGYIFAPLFSIIFIYIAYILERIYFKTRSIEVYYFTSLALIRLGFVFGQNTMNMINDLSMNLFLFFIVYTINNLLTNFSRS